MKGYQIWMEVYVEDDEDWCCSSGHIENRCYSSTIYLDKNKAEEVKNGINKLTAYPTCGLSASYCKDLFLREVEIK